MSSPPRRPILPVVAYSALLLAMSVLFFAGGYLFGNLEGRTGNGPLAWAGLTPPPSTPAGLSEQDQAAFRVFWEAWNEVQQNYYRRDSLDDPRLVRGAVKGMVEALEDPYSTYLTPQNREISEADLRGSFDGVGVQVDLRDGRLRVVAPIDGSPGDHAGLRPGDVIRRVDGQDISHLSLTEAVAKIRGPRGTTVVLTIQPDGESETRDVPVVRGEIKVDSVRSRMLGESSIGYLRISQFGEMTAAQSRTQLRELLAHEPRGLILDVRSNPGGYLSSAVDITSQFLRDGVVLYQRRNAQGTEPREIRTTGSPVVPDLPLVVLVDRGSASASEIVAGALRDNGRAVLVGEKTFGKGTVQEIRNLSDRSQLRVTVAEWLTPSQQPIQGEGIVPDVTVTAEADRDVALDAAVDYLRTRETASRG